MGGCTVFTCERMEIDRLFWEFEYLLQRVKLKFLEYIGKGEKFENLIRRMLEKCYHIILDYKKFDWHLSSWLDKAKRNEYYKNY